LTPGTQPLALPTAPEAKTLADSSVVTQTASSPTDVIVRFICLPFGCRDAYRTGFRYVTVASVRQAGPSQYGRHDL
jgi:hypothetical protein